jgi:hypothetical protein
MIQHPKEWFIDRIGQTIYRRPILSCTCAMCRQGTAVKISDRFHAMYIKDCQDDLEIEYSDKPYDVVTYKESK